MVSIVGLGKNAVGEFLPVTPQRLTERRGPSPGGREVEYPPIWSRPHSFLRWDDRLRGHITGKAFQE